MLSLGCSEGGGRSSDIPTRQERRGFRRRRSGRSAVERQLEIIGEALSQLAKVDPQMASNVAELRRVIAFQSSLVHGYAAIDYDTVWRLIPAKLPELQTNLSGGANHTLGTRFGGRLATHLGRSSCGQCPECCIKGRSSRKG